VPTAILAQNSRKALDPKHPALSPGQTWVTQVLPTTDVASVQRPEPLPGRMTVGGPAAQDAVGADAGALPPADAAGAPVAAGEAVVPPPPAYRAPTRVSRKKGFGTRSVQRIFTAPLGLF
jgi:hypothetical protein